ncbi:MAG: hypothetical protein K2M75_03450 [Clostridia bacterium]|nr:hypothetical protein [Clostridia bacterium]
MSNLQSGSNPNTRRSKNLAILALMLALTIFFCFFPIVFPGGVTLAFMILPLLIIAQGYDFKMTITLGVLMAIVNQIAWFTTKAASPMAPIWQNPLVCMVPRILIGVVSYFEGLGLRKAFLRPKYRNTEEGKALINQKQLYAIDGAISGLSTAFGVLTNTLFCGLFTVLLYNGKLLTNGTKISLEYILTWFGINFVIEIIAFSILVPPIVIALRQAKLVPPPKMGKEIIIEDLSTAESENMEKEDKETEKDKEEDLSKSQ